MTHKQAVRTAQNRHMSACDINESALLSESNYFIALMAAI